MDYRYGGDVDKLEGHAPVGSGECVALVQIYAEAPLTSKWRPGRRVLDGGFIAVGTAIATFAGPHAPFKSGHGNHAALFMYAGPIDPATSQPAFIVVMDQWQGRRVKSRRINYHSPDAAKKKQILDSDNADAYYIISR